MFWTTRDGRTIALGEMTDQHLSNTIAYLSRRLVSIQDYEDDVWGSYTMLNGEAAQYYAESEINRLSKQEDTTTFWLKQMQAEQTKRRTSK